MWAVNITKELPKRREENERAKHGETFTERGVARMSGGAREAPEWRLEKGRRKSVLLR